MNRIESVQYRTACFIFNNYRTISVTCMLKKLNLPLLSDRRSSNKMIPVFIILNDIIDIFAESIATLYASQT